MSDVDRRADAPSPPPMHGGSPDPFSALKIGPALLPNRFIRAGANEMMTRAGRPQRSLLEFHRRLAAGGVGMTTLAYVAVSPDGRTFADQGVLSCDSLRSYRAVVDAVHAEGARASAQLTHAGSFVQHRALSTRRAMSASGGVDKMGVMMGRFLQRHMTRADMAAVRGEFVAAAQLAAEAGFDAVELHMGHGYLLNQFISPLSNRRRDCYGGDARARARFPAEVMSAVRDAVGDRVAVLAKINLVDGVPRGATVEDAAATAWALEAAGAHMLVLSGGRNIEASWQIFGSLMPYDDLAAMQPGLLAKLQFAILKRSAPAAVVPRELYFLDAARRVRAAVTMPLCYIGGIRSLAAARAALDHGFEALQIARALVHDPRMVARWRSGETRTSACDAGNRCVAAMYSPEGTHCVLARNAIPAAMNRIDADA